MFKTRVACFEFGAWNSFRISRFELRASQALLILLAVFLFSGCHSEPASFKQNAAYKLKMERANMGSDEGAPTALSAAVTSDIGNILEALFGTPDAPKVPAVEDLEMDKLVDLRNLHAAARPVASDRTGAPQGLYREHCVHCHGISGDGNGPTAAFLNPYPRDYRMGLYKFKSSKKGEKPTHDDLRRILTNGIAGTAMPSFALLPETEIDALIDYVKYLSMRGELERKLFAYATQELTDPFDTLYPQYTSLSQEHAALTAAGGADDPTLKAIPARLKQVYNELYNIRSSAKKFAPEKSTEEPEPVDDLPAKIKELDEAVAQLEQDVKAYQPPRMYQLAASSGAEPSEADKTQLKEQLQPYLEMAKEVMEPWTTAQSVAVPEPPHGLDPNDRESIARGRAIFYGPIANCFSCHGESGLGDGQRDFYDDWSGEWVEKGKPEATAAYVAAGALQPRNLIPRNLRLGIYRGGRRPVDHYWRLVNGIDGAQMPAVPLLAEGDPPGTKKLSQEELWDLINYIRSLPYEAISQPGRVEQPLAKELQ
jgi:mono/diheme cytochrome c family protein